MKESNGMLKKTQVCACKFVCPQKVSLSAEGTVLSPRWLRTVSKARFYLRQTRWELEDGRRERLRGRQAPRSCWRSGANTQSGSPSLFGSAKVTIRISPALALCQGKVASGWFSLAIHLPCN